MSCTQESTKKPDTTQPEPTKWINGETSSAHVSLAKRKDDRKITVDVHVLGKKLKALLISNEKNADFDSQNIGEYLHAIPYTCVKYWHPDIKAMFYFKDIDVIRTATKARWTPEWVVFYHDEWDMNNFTASVRIFPPAVSILESERMA